MPGEEDLVATKTEGKLWVDKFPETQNIQHRHFLPARVETRPVEPQRFIGATFTGWTPPPSLPGGGSVCLKNRPAQGTMETPGGWGGGMGSLPARREREGAQGAAGAECSIGAHATDQAWEQDAATLRKRSGRCRPGGPSGCLGNACERYGSKRTQLTEGSRGLAGRPPPTPRLPPPSPFGRGPCRPLAR